MRAGLVVHQRLVPVHQADEEQVLEQVGLEFDVREVVVVVPEVAEVDFVVGGFGEPIEGIAAVVKLLLVHDARRAGVVEDCLGSFPANFAGGDGL